MHCVFVLPIHTRENTHQWTHTTYDGLKQSLLDCLLAHVAPTTVATTSNDYVWLHSTQTNNTVKQTNNISSSSSSSLRTGFFNQSFHRAQAANGHHELFNVIVVAVRVHQCTHHNGGVCWINLWWQRVMSGWNMKCNERNQLVERKLRCNATYCFCKDISSNHRQNQIDHKQ